MNTLTLEEVSKIITSKTIQEGGMAKHMWEDSFIPYIELLQKYLARQNIKMVFIEEKK